MRQVAPDILIHFWKGPGEGQDTLDTALDFGHESIC